MLLTFHYPVKLVFWTNANISKEGEKKQNQRGWKLPTSNGLLVNNMKCYFWVTAWAKVRWGVQSLMIWLPCLCNPKLIKGSFTSDWETDENSFLGIKGSIHLSRRKISFPDKFNMNKTNTYHILHQKLNHHATRTSCATGTESPKYSCRCLAQHGKKPFSMGTRVTAHWLYVQVQPENANTDSTTLKLWYGNVDGQKFYRDKVIGRMFDLYNECVRVFNIKMTEQLCSAKQQISCHWTGPKRWINVEIKK